MDKPTWIWLAFLSIIIFLLIFDLGVLHQKEHEIDVKESLWLSLFYILAATFFGVWVWSYLGTQSGEEYFTGYLIEKSLSIDNIFIISLIFKYFKVPRLYQHRVLIWGILGVLVMRAVMISAGILIINLSSWIMYIFALFLIYMGVKMFLLGKSDYKINDKLLIFLQRHLRITPEFHGHAFFITTKDTAGRKQLWITPLLLALIFIELTDFIFAVDSVPAIFAVTTDPFIIYTSNIFAILGLRALYFALDAIIHRFQYLKYALAAILIFIGSKIFIADWLGMEKFPASISLGVTFTILATGLFYSMYKTRSNLNA